jgi:hypothetical protein
LSWAAWPRGTLHVVNRPLLELMGFNRYYIGLLSIGLGVYAIVKRNIGVGPSVLIRPQFSVTGFPAVLLGVALVGLGVLVVLLRD